MREQKSSILNNKNIKHCAIRVFMAWCFVSMLQTIFFAGQRIYINNLEFVGRVNLLLSITATIGVAAILFILFAIIKDITGKETEPYESVLLLIVTFCYACVCSYNSGDVLFEIILSGILALETVYCYRLTLHSVSININKTLYFIITGVLITLFTVLIGLYMAVRVKSYSAPDFDCGIFSQMFHYMKTTGKMYTTVERDRLLNHLAVHFSPVMYLILPFYMIFPSPVTLQIMQVLVVAFAVIPLSMLARKKGLSYVQTLLISGIYLLGPVFAGGCFYDIHENMFFPLLIFSLLYFVENETRWQKIGIAVTMVLLWLTKEDASAYVMCISLYVIFEKKKLNQGLIMLFSSLSYFIVVTVMLNLLGEGIITGGFNNMIYEENGNLFGIIKTLIVNPVYIFSQLTDYSKIIYMVQILGCMAFLPLVTKKWYRFTLALPFIIFNLMPDYEYYHNIFFQFTLGSGSLLLFMALLNLADIKVEHSNKRMNCMLLIALECSIIMSVAFIAPQLENVTDYYSGENRQVYESISEGLGMIPKEASVKASPNFCVALSDHDELYDNMFSGCHTEYIAIDLRQETERQSAVELYDNPSFENIYYKENVIVVFRCK